jgi:hypothetical protein
LDLTRAIWTLNIAASAGLLVRLLYSNLARTYRFLFAFVLINVVQALALVAIPMRTKIYAQGYMIETAVELLLAVAVVMELYAAALADHPALAKFGSRTVGYLLIAAGVVTATALGIDETVPVGQSIVLHRFFRVERTMDFGIVMFLLLISIFLVWFPVRVKRNVVYYVVGFALFYASRSVGILILNVLPPSWRKQVNNGMLSISLISLVFLALCLRRESDSAKVVRQHSNPAVVAHLAVQLESINAALSRLARR